MNRQIRADYVRVIGDDGKNLDVMPLSRAIEMAEEKGLDLVEVSPNMSPPVVKIMDYGKYKYEMKKRAHEAKMHAHIMPLKEIRLYFKMDVHDLEVKVRKLRELLEDLHRVQVTMMLHGREMKHIEKARENMRAVWEKVQDLGKMEKEATEEGNRIVMVIMPKPELIKQKEEKLKAERMSGRKESNERIGKEKVEEERKDAEVKGEGFVS
ncbi:MAG: translation initiation factor IF-3 [Planctomycetota bacterium]|nr:translation initiation factor IF-3 [Planctomycetota bacterium]